MRARTEFQASRFQAFCQAAPRARACSARCSGGQVRGRRRRVGVGHALQPFAVDAAHAAPGQVVERDLIRLAGLARAEEEAAVAAPVRLDLDVDLEVLVFLVGQENPALAARTLGADDQPVEHVVVGRRPVVVRLADMPAGQILAVEDRRESFRHLRTVISRRHLIHVGRRRLAGSGACAATTQSAAVVIAAAAATVVNLWNMEPPERRSDRRSDAPLKWRAANAPAPKWPLRSDPARSADVRSARVYSRDQCFTAARCSRSKSRPKSLSKSRHTEWMWLPLFCVLSNSMTNVGPCTR